MTRTRLALVALSLMLLAGCSGGSSRATGPSPPPRATPASPLAGVSADRPCGSAAAPPARFDHVVWIWMENKAYGDILGQTGDATYLNRLAERCGLATNYHNVTHPSLPNYLAAVAGSTGGVTTNCDPAVCPLDRPTLFGQVAASGREWRAYAESMPRNCALTKSGDYAPKHNPAVYYRPIAADCKRWNVPLGTTAGGAFVTDLRTGKLPAFALVVPDLCNDMHNCSVRTGDDWLSRWMTELLSSPAYLEGRTAVFVTWDEGKPDGANDCATNTTDPGCHVFTVVVSPYTPAGLRSGALFNHYSMLRATEEVLGLPPLGAAADASSAGMRAAFRLGAG